MSTRRYTFDPRTNWPYRSPKEMRWGLVFGIGFNCAVVIAATLIAFAH